MTDMLYWKLEILIEVMCKRFPLGDYGQKRPFARY